MSELKRVWIITIASYVGAFFLLLLIAVIPEIEVSPMLIAVAAIVGMILLATQKLKIFIKRHEILTTEDLEKSNTKIVWALMVGEYFWAVFFAILVLSE